MRVPLRWLQDFVDIDLPVEELARVLTFAGLEVEAMEYFGLPLPADRERQEAKISGLAWDPDKIVVADVLEVLPHPDADKLVLARADDGTGTHTIVTGAPNLYPFKGQGPLDEPLKVAYAREGSKLYDGYASERKVKKLKRSKIRGVESYAMACSEKELGISDEHEGIILFDTGAPAAGTPLVDYLGDVVLDIAITPNMARIASIHGVAREVAALTGAELQSPSEEVEATGPPVADKIRIDIRESELNPRFTATLIEGLTIKSSPYWLQYRLRLAGMRPISNIVDVTNYAMLEVGQPLHAYDYDVLVERAKASGAEVPTLTTRLPEPGERLETLDGVDRELDDFTILVCDAGGTLGLGGIMGGAESEVSDDTTSVLLEAAGWNFINVRRSVQAQQLATSEAGYRFSRGVHPAMASRGNLRAIELMRQLGGGTVCEGMVDEYPAPPEAVVVDLPLSEIPRYLGMEIEKPQVVRILEGLEFGVEDRGDTLSVTVPDHRMDVGTGVAPEAGKLDMVGIADLIEEIVRIFGYERIPETQITDTTPPQHGNPSLEAEERVRDLLVDLGLQEIVTYRLTTPEREARARLDGAADERAYVTMSNPISVERTSMRHELLPSVLEIAERNARVADRLAVFEIGAVYLPRDGEVLPEEPRRLAIVMSGARQTESWTGADTATMDFFDLKGVVESLCRDLHLPDVAFEPGEHPSLHPGRCATLTTGSRRLGELGELHPKVREAYGFEQPVLAADLDLEALLDAIPERHAIREIPRFPAVVEDLALVVGEDVPAVQVEQLIAQTGGRNLRGVRLFDLFRGDQIGAGKRSLAYRLSFQSDERTLTDKAVAKIRNKIVKRLEREVGAVLRS